MCFLHSLFEGREGTVSGFESFEFSISSSPLFHLGERETGNYSSLNSVLGENIQRSHAIKTLAKQTKKKQTLNFQPGK